MLQTKGIIVGLFQRIFNRAEEEPLTPSGSLPILDLTKPRRLDLNDYAALYSVAYMACEQTKARSIGSLPVAVYRKDGDTRKRVDHPFADLLSGQANEFMTGRDLRNWFMLRRDTFGNAYLWTEFDKYGNPLSIWPITGYVSVSYDKNARRDRRVRYSVSGDKYVPTGTYFSYEVINLRTVLTENGIDGKSIAKLAAHEVGLSIDLEEFYSSMLHNGNHHLGHVEVPAGRMDPKDREALRSSVDKFSGVERAGAAPILGYGAKWVSNQQSMRDATLVEQQAWVLQQVCRATNVPPWMVYDSSAGNGKYENAEAARVDYVTGTVMPDASSIEAAFNAVLRAIGEEDLYLKFDLSGLMRGDAASRGQFYREMVYSGTYTRADVRAKEDMPPIPGLEKPLVPLNYGILEPDGTVTVLNSSSKEPADGMQTGVTE